MNKDQIQEGDLIIEYCPVKDGVGGIGEDDYQEALVRVIDKTGQNEIKQENISLIYRVAKNVRYERLKAEKLEHYHLKKLFVLYRRAQRNLHIDTNPELEEKFKILKAALAELTPKCRQAIVLVYFDGLKPKQAAKMIGCDFKVFWDRLEYGIECLRKKFGKFYKNLKSL
jgi:RNA polymerase sigma factor (sigma-70 family)